VIDLPVQVLGGTSPYTSDCSWTSTSVQLCRGEVDKTWLGWERRCLW